MLQKKIIIVVLNLYSCKCDIPFFNEFLVLTCIKYLEDIYFLMRFENVLIYKVFLISKP